MEMPSDPVTRRDRTELFACIGNSPHVGLAVSGGADSIALMHLACRWRDERGGNSPDLSVLTVDHGLRAQSANEAQWVAERARELGLACHVLRWHPGEKHSRIQADARQARYDLMVSCALEHGITALVTAHHLDDQAETLLMRLGRGSGLDGLAGIHAQGAWGGLELLRPFLDIPKSRLVASLEADGIVWLEDPSNDDERFERVHLRKAITQLEQLGIGADALARSARRLRRASEALEGEAGHFLKSGARLSDAGYCEIDATKFALIPDEIALRVLSRALRGIGGRVGPPRLASLEALLRSVRAGGDENMTLGGCLVHFNPGSILVTREGGSSRGPEKMDLRPGHAGLWDGRYRVSLGPDCKAPVEVRPLGRDGFGQVRARLHERLSLPGSAVAGLVSFWRNDTLLAVPPLGYMDKGPEGSECDAEFVNGGLFR